MASACELRELMLSFPLDEKSLCDDYLELQKNMVFIILKINEEHRLKRVFILRFPRIL